jgi:Zn-finger nucleic acid-binding protein
MGARIRCPRDGAEARRLPSKRAKGKSCPTCGGVWFEAGQMGRFMGDEELEREIVACADDPAGIECPGCGAPMATCLIGEAAARVCTACNGLWVDRGDIEVSASLLESPALPGVAKGIGRGDLTVGVSSLARTPRGVAAFTRRRGTQPP